MYLPRSRAPVTLVTANEPAGQPQGQGETVLIVEDNPDVKTVAIALLEQLNYRTIAVENAEAALSFLSNGAPVDLVFSDVMLPGDVDGLALAETIKGKYPNLPVLLKSGYAKALAGHHRVPILRKPYQVAALAQAVRSTLHSRAISKV
jgi:two-component system, NtrC family, sensor kinase